MANRERGEVALEVEGVTYTMVLDLDAMCQLEDFVSTPEREWTFGEVFERASRGSARHIRAIVWAALQRHHKGITVDAVSELIQAVGGLGAFSEKLAALSVSTRPDAADVRELGGPKSGRPRRAQSGAGGNSTLKPVASA